MSALPSRGNLATFLAAAHERVAAGAYALRGPPLRPHGGLCAALEAHRMPIIAELKPRSPTEGRLLHQPAGDVLAGYRQGGAAALSVLADADAFDGSPALVRQAHEQGLPILFKDFVVDETQVVCAAHCGASAILLIERAFGGQAQRREALVECAHDAGLEVLLELFDAADWESAKKSKADLFGVNARDLDSLVVDAAGSLRLVATVAKERLVVALSGIDGRSSHRRARAAGACSVLVGTALLRSSDPALALRALQRPLAKVCGLRTAADVQEAAASGADLAGFVVGSPTSPRDLLPSQAQALVAQAAELGLRTVLVTRNGDWQQVLDWCRLVRPDFLQLHGAIPGREWIQSLAAIPVHLLMAVGPDQPWPADASGVVLDTTSEGGSGRAHDWQAARPLFAQAPDVLSFVAGGLDASNVAAALHSTLAWGADASSRLESEPGRKDPQRVASFVKAVHTA